MTRTNLSGGGVRFLTRGNVQHTAFTKDDDGTVVVETFNPSTGETSSQPFADLSAAIAQAESDARAAEAVSNFRSAPQCP